MSKQRAARAPSPETEPTAPQSAGREHPPGDSLSSQPAGATPQPTPAGSPAERTGVDSRQRGWYWHWNGIVTQYAPLIGLKGVGLLNSYTVWTDRRDQSPTRGYAFPSQQSEASFYGEDRAELITINKILVALDLIEIRKEMVQRTDPQGRKWKVPHNLYRVKDRPEGLDLQTADVLRVAQLASKDAAVFRYVKRIFSSRFAPIDRDNAWHTILKEVADDPIWQELTAKTARIEARTSARSKAGHKARTKQDDNLEERDQPGAKMTTGHSDKAMFDGIKQDYSNPLDSPTSVEQNNPGSGSDRRDVSRSNNGSEPDVEQVNTGSQGGDASSAEETNNGQQSVVAPSNATYYQEISTTTTTTEHSENGWTDEGVPASDPLESKGHIAWPEDQDDPDRRTGSYGLDNNSAVVQAPDESEADREGRRAPERSLADPASGGPLVDPGPLVISLFEAANSRSASPLERILLGELERDAGVPAGRCGESGSDWVCAALREAVSSGSAFVAPKRIREILNRWAASGSRPGIEPPPQAPVTPGTGGTARAIRLPRGRSAEKVWAQVLEELAGVLDAATHARLFGGSRLAGYRAGAVEIEVQAGAESKLSAEYRPLVQRHLERHIGRDVTVAFVASPEPRLQPEPEAARPAIVVSTADAEQGRQLWRAVLNKIAPLVGADDLARLGGALPLGQDAEGHIVIGAATSLAARLIEGRCRVAIEAALLAVLGDTVTVKIATHGNWSVEDDEAQE